MELPRLDAELLLSHLLEIRRLDLYLQFERPLSSAELADYKALIKRRVNNEPVACIIGKKEFWSRDFIVSPAVLIPRPDTEVLVEVVLDFIKSSEKNEELSGFEFGIGSGNIAITLLAELPKSNITAIETSVEAIDIAKKNADFHGVSDRLEITSHELGDTGDKYNFIVSNPPYIPTSEINELPPSVKDYEPHEALDGGEGGLKFYRVLTPWASAHLKEGGFYAVEIGEEQGDAVKEIFEGEGFKDVRV